MRGFIPRRMLREVKEEYVEHILALVITLTIVILAYILTVLSDKR